MSEADDVPRGELVRFQVGTPAYWRSPELQQGFANAVAARTPTILDDATHWPNLGAIREAAELALRDIEDTDRNALIAGVDRLPTMAQSAIWWELGNGSATMAHEAPNEDVRDLAAASEEGGDLVRIWGGMAPRRLGQLQAKVARLSDMMWDADRPTDDSAWYAFVSWVRSLPAPTWRTLMFNMAR